MDDVLTPQAEIKAIYHPRRARDGGKFVSAAAADRIAAARAARKQALKMELIAMGRLAAGPRPGCTLVKQHERHVGPKPDPLPTLFDARAA